MKVKSFLKTLSAFLVIALVFATIPLVSIAMKSLEIPIYNSNSNNPSSSEATPLQSDAPNRTNHLKSRSAKNDTILVENMKFSHTLDLASDISITFAILKSTLADYDSYYLECNIPVYSGNELVSTSTVTIDPIDKGPYYYFTLTGVTAVNMGDTIDAVLHMTKGTDIYISSPDSYSVASYAYNMLKKSKDDKMLTLCANLLRYGAEAQCYKQYRTDSLVDAAMTETHRSYLTDTQNLSFTITNSVLNDVTNPTITWVGKSLDLGSKVGLKFVFDTKNYSGDISTLSMRINYVDSFGIPQSVTQTSAEPYNTAKNQYCFTYYGLSSAELRTVLGVSIYDGDTQLSETLFYSAESYAFKTLNTTLAPLCKALFAYSDSALLYFSGTLPISTYIVTFKDWDGTVLKNETVASGKSATAPDNPGRKGYGFDGWDKPLSPITEDTTITAKYTKVYTVTFIDYDGKILDEPQQVAYGESADAPPNPTLDHYEFECWDTDFSTVTEDLIVQAIYKKVTYPVKFLTNNNVTIEEQSVEHGADAEAPAYNDIFTELYFDWNTYSMRSFSGWSGSLEKIDGARSVSAQYENEYEQPVISIETNADNSSATFRLYAPKDCYIYAISFEFNYPTYISVDTYDTKNAVILSNAVISYNNGSKEFCYGWVSSEGVNIANPKSNTTSNKTPTFANIVEVRFNTDGGVEISKDILESFDNCSVVFASTENALFKDLQIITPEIKMN